MGLYNKYVSEEKDLGIIFDSQLKFHAHTTLVVSKAIEFSKTFIKLYKTLVRSILEYGNIICGQ